MLYSLKLVLCVILGEVEYGYCFCVVGKVGYCNYIVVFMFKLCKFYFNGCIFIEDLFSELG